VPSASIHDAIVVGAGPAGATAARKLASAGIGTLLLDRATFPRHKACGGAITTRVLARFPYLSAALERIPTHWIARLVLQGPSGRSAELNSNGPAVLTIRRVEFDALLVSLAREAGAELAEATEIYDVREDSDRVRLQTRDGRTFDARMVIAADGVHGLVSRRLGLLETWPRHQLAVDLMEETPDATLRATDRDALWVSYGFPASRAGGPRGLADGYAYVFPKREHVNVGIGYLAHQFRTKYRGSAYALQQGLIGRLTGEGVLDGTSSRGHFTPFLIPVGGPLRRTGTARVLLAGDAGGFVNGFSAEGIYYAMVSGDLAAASVADALAARQPACSLYHRRWHAEIGSELAESAVLQRLLFEDARRIDALVEAAADGTPLVGVVTRWAQGLEAYAALRCRIVLRNPFVGILFGAMLLQRRLEATRAAAFQSEHS
jgi:geranylgeranyl reductase family protein